MTTPQTHPHSQTLLVSCPDQSGLIHAVSGVLFNENCNVIENGEFVDLKQKHFFMRTEFEGSADTVRMTAEIEKLLPKPCRIAIRPSRARRIVILATREHHCLGDLLLRHSFGELHAKVVGVISQYSTLKKLTERFEIPYFEVPVAELSREAHEEKISQALSPLKADLLVLAKYMRVLTPSFVDEYAGRIINIHHSFLPAFAGSKPYQQAYERGVKLIGATAHFVTSGLDQGPIITQSVIPIDHTYSPEKLARAGHDVETQVLARGLNLVLEDRVIVHGGRTIIF